ncbi:LuxR C-terminal-related transcriptional regulator [Microbacterium sp. zg.B48]|uniref:LuxR C-terminal-related transcriptional regulator n=1 Tax=unclassified Microbacterium TaxID=2609290 RepID=UPI00214BDF27|nr:MULTISPECIES: LuxR C-terminal-related transcriptional regulator [unclassified Microbacterium]MCR2763929.1 LuxR C-terminal-related transcriptional regulator [Microbacterium sp. zg.B48]MCR2810352.1 LuxR C-terminal-related transcriptional regulator [Microbacterium sp. zg.B185]WIM18409.1 LuxR C-terminal-related transcriptional regulator [Microbacterium sp. zg-B185]
MPSVQSDAKPGGVAQAAEIVRGLADVLTAPSALIPQRLSAFLGPLLGHSALVFLVADAAGGQREGAGAASFVDGVSFLALDELRRMIGPGRTRRGVIPTSAGDVDTFQALSNNGALLVLADPGGQDTDAAVLQLWNIVALRVQELADAASPDYLQLARATSGVRMEALTELADEYSTTLESLLAALRSSSLDDRSARRTATQIAAEGMVHLRTASDRVRTFTEEPVTTAFERLRDDLRPLVRYRDIDVQFVEPPVDGRALPSEIAHGARAVVRGSILALVDRHDVSRVRVQWDCDGTNLLINVRDDGPGDLSGESVQLRLVRQRVLALNGRLSFEATPGWGTEMSVVMPLDPPSALAAAPRAWDLGPREAEVLSLLIAGQRNREIAVNLGISENTVKFHVAKIFRKLGVASRAEATAFVLAGRHGASSGRA